MFASRASLSGKRTSSIYLCVLLELLCVFLSGDIYLGDSAPTAVKFCMMVRICPGRCYIGPFKC